MIIKRFIFSMCQRIICFYNNATKNNNGSVLMFHEISEKNTEFSISKGNFICMVRELKSAGYKIVKLNEMATEKDLVITFDDAFDSVYYEIFEYLKNEKIPFYMFVNIEKMNKKGFVTEEMIEEMLKYEGYVLGSHGLKHDLYRNKIYDDVIKELKESKEVLEKKFSTKIENFAFPYGSLYAVSKKNINCANKIYENVFLTLPLNYDYNYGNVYPRKNVNNSNFRKILKK